MILFSKGCNKQDFELVFKEIKDVSFVNSLEDLKIQLVKDKNNCKKILNLF